MSNTTQHVGADPDRLEAIVDSASDKGVRHSGDAHDLKSSGPLADPVYRAAVEKEFAGIKALFEEYLQALVKVYQVPKVPDPK